MRTPQGPARQRQLKGDRDVTQRDLGDGGGRGHPLEGLKCDRDISQRGFGDRGTPRGPAGDRAISQKALGVTGGPCLGSQQEVAWTGFLREPWRTLGRPSGGQCSHGQALRWDLEGPHALPLWGGGCCEVSPCL